ncbi:hypothetical protein bcere0022_5650 [Bacillus cereus Rock3-44]|nr:hypothetical protein bcere0022_5650 [Bacillus cereus Rock3-44]
MVESNCFKVAKKFLRKEETFFISIQENISFLPIYIRHI